MSQSALLGEPPNTENDYYIVKGIIQRFHIHGLDPANGIRLGARPLHAQNNSRASQIIAGSIACIVLIVFITGSRLCIRALHPKVKWGWDDWLIIPGAGFTIAWLVSYILWAVYAGAGQHIYNLSYHQYYLFDKITEIALLFFLIASTCIKLSLTLFIRRLIGQSSKFWIWVNNFFLALLSIYLVVFLCLDSFRCDPVAANFSLIATGKLDHPPKCRNITSGTNVRVYSHVAFDFCLLCTPAIILWKVQMPLAKKLRILATFAIGSVSCIGSVMTLVAQDHLDVTDITFNFTYMFTWVMIDLFFGIVVASAPILPVQVLKSWKALSSYCKTRFSSHSSKDGSLERSSEKGTSISESKKKHWLDETDQGCAATPKREHDLESGQHGSSQDQRYVENHSVQAPSRLYHPRGESAV